MQRRKTDSTPSQLRGSNSVLESKIHHVSSSSLHKKLKVVLPLIILASLLLFLGSRHGIKESILEITSKTLEGHGHEHSEPPPDIERLPPRPVDGEGKSLSKEASAAMLRAASTWVDGEKALKKGLVKLMENQRKGIDVGVDHLTRWMGDGVPLWTPKSIFPSPIPPNSEIIIQPKYGSHRQGENAVFSFAQDYPLDTYLSFIKSLKNTGYAGDIVLAISTNANEDVTSYLQSEENVIVYAVEWECVDGKGNLAKDSREGQNKCKMMDFYGSNGKAIPDSRDYRPVATARYELYYAWSLAYNQDNLVFLVDFRDTYFQKEPFEGLEKGPPDNGLLLFFAESSETNIGKSNYNKRWLEAAYKRENVSGFFSKTIICSGTTMGNGKGLRTYLEAMVAQYDTTLCNMKGCDQGFHNYLYYSKGLHDAVDKIVVFEQGVGIVNNLGALREKSLKERGILDENGMVLNWDKTISHVAHQVDRDQDLNKIVKNRKSVFKKEWNQEKALHKEER